MPPKPEELTLVYLRERIRFDSGTCILDCEEQSNGKPKQPCNKFGWACGGFHDATSSTSPSITVKTECEPDELLPHVSYRFYGHWTDYRNKRTGETTRQFKASHFVKTEPHGQAGVTRYLMQAPHVGYATAQVLWEKFAGDAVRILRESPDVAVAAVAGAHFTTVKAAEAAHYLEGERAMEGCTLELMDLLGGQGFPKQTGKKAVAEWGNEAARLIKKNPYLLMRFRGCGFMRCDKLYRDLGYDLRRLKRQTLCAWYTLSRATANDGHTWHTAESLTKGMRKMIGGTGVKPQAAAILGRRAKLLDIRRDQASKVWFAEKAKAENEAYVAEKIIELSREDPHWPDVATLDVSDHQREKLSAALSGPVALFGGTPGTGKTYSAARVIGALNEQFGQDAVAVVAPTGKAAVRITELMQGYGLSVRARTIHSLLGVESHTAGDGWGFQHNESNPLPYRVVVVDESSMIDCDLAASLLRACAPGTHLLFVGDTYQLPPVGHGAPLRNWIAAGVPYGELREIRRNAGSIVRACAAIRDGMRFEADKELNPIAGKNLLLAETSGNAQTLDRLLAILRTVRARKLLDPVWQVQIIVAVNQKSELSRIEINRRLQTELNPDGAGVKGSPFRTGDKIVCLKNGLMPIAEGGDFEANQELQGDGGDQVYVANGEIGRVLQVEEKRTFARLEAPLREIVIPRGSDSNGGETKGDGGSNGGNNGGDDASATGCNFDLAYGVTCHKMQGSEIPLAIVLGDTYPGARQVCGREWLYTAISRAKQACILIGQEESFQAMRRRPMLDRRKTFLREMILEGKEKG